MTNPTPVPPPAAPAAPQPAAYAGDPNFAAYPQWSGEPFAGDPNFAGDPANDPAALAENLTPRQRFWRKFGGEAFLLSIGINALCIIIAALWIISTNIIYPKPPEEFVTGAGGGNNGDVVSMTQHRIKPKNARNMVRTPTRILSKSSSASVTLPDMPSLSMNALQSSSSLAGSVSKGSGGGAGGGIGTGLGPGRGGGRNMVSLFGARGMDVAGLVGVIYDIKQTSSKGQTPATNDTNAYVAVCNQFINSNWNDAVLRKYYRSEQQLSLQQVLMPLRPGNAGEAPKSFGVEKEIKPSRWIVHYKGRVKAPFSGKMRFVGMADDWITVRWEGKNRLVSGYPGSHAGTYSSPPRKGAKPTPPPPGVGDTYPYGGGRPPFQTGPWFTVTKDSQYNMEIAMGETPGGEFCATLAFQRDTKDAPLLLFRMSGGTLDKIFTDGSRGEIPKNVDINGGGFVWTPVMPKTGVANSGPRM